MDLRAYLLLAAYPAVVLLVADWCGPGFRWAAKNRSPLLPPALKEIQERRGKFVLLIRYGLTLVALSALASKDQWHILATQANLQSWPMTLTSGIVAGLLIIGFRRILALVWQPIAVSEARDYLLRGPSGLWLTIFVVGGFAEEVWRALCISSFLQSGHRASFAVVLPALAFSLAHMSGLPSRIPGGLEIASAEAITGLLFGALFLWSGTFLTPYLASVVYYTSNLYWLRSRHFFSNADSGGPRM